MLILRNQMQQRGATGAWVKVEYHTILIIPVCLYFDTGKPLYLIVLKKGAFPAIFRDFLVQKFFFKLIH